MLNIEVDNLMLVDHIINQFVEAVYCLWVDGQIDLYKNYTESDSSTEGVRWSEFEERTAEEVLSGK